MASGPRMRRASDDRRVVLADVHAVRPHLEREVGPVVEHEGHAEVAAHGGRQPGPGQQRLGLELLVPQLDDVHPAGDAVGEEGGQVGPVRRAEVEAALARGRAARSRRAAGLCLGLGLHAPSWWP